MTSLYPTISVPKVEIHLVGRWSDAANLPIDIQEAINTGYQQAVNHYTERFSKTIIKAIRTGNPPQGSGVYWPPLAESTQRRYHKGPDSHFYITGIYSRSIRIRRTKRYTTVGLARGQASAGSRDRRSGKSIAEVARILEFGTGDGGKTTIPARPLWRATLQALGGKPAIKAEVMKYIRRALLAKGIRANQVRFS